MIPPLNEEYDLRTLPLVLL